MIRTSATPGPRRARGGGEREADSRPQGSGSHSPSGPETPGTLVTELAPAASRSHDAR